MQFLQCTAIARLCILCDFLGPSFSLSVWDLIIHKTTFLSLIIIFKPNSNYLEM